MKTLRSIKIIDYLKDRKFCSMKELGGHFDVSPATIHRDVAELAKTSIIRKFHGGVAYGQELVIPAIEDKVVSNFSTRIESNVEAKTQIANNAISFISDGDVIFLDSSTTVYYLAKAIQATNFSHFTIITNSVLIIQEFYKFPSSYYLIALGGNFSCQLDSFLGKTSIENLKRLRIDKAFISGVGITQEGLFTYHEEHADFLKEMLKITDKTYLLLDNTKFDKAGIFPICQLKELYGFCSNKKPPEYVQSDIKVCC